MTKRRAKPQESVVSNIMVATVVAWDQVPDFKAVPEGEYGVILSAKKFNEEKNYWALTFTIQDEDQPDFNGKKLFRNFSMKPDALPFLKQFLIVMGTDPEVFAGAVDTEQMLDDVMGVGAVAVVSHSMYNGESRANVDRIKALAF